MKFSRALTYAAPIEDVRAMLCTPEFWDTVASATGAISSTTTVTDDKVVTDEEQQVAGVPSFAKKFVGDSTRAIKTFRWNGNTAAFSVDTPGKPTSISGTATLNASGDATQSTVLRYDLDVKASVPLVGGKLEKLVADLITGGFTKEQAAGIAWLDK